MIYADNIFFNGKIYTMKEENQTAEAMVVHDEKIIYIGSNEEALKFPARSKEDLQGKTVLPGFIDTHLHFVMECEAQERVNLEQAKSIEEIIDVMKKNSSSDSDTMVGINVHIENLKEGRFPFCKELDAISEDKSVVLLSYCRHASMGNSKAVKLSGLSKTTVPEVEGTVEFCDDGEPNGIIRESAYGDYYAPLIEGKLDDYTFRKELLKRNLPKYAKLGMTTLHTFTSLSENPMEFVNQYMDLEAEKALPIRIILNSSVEVPKLLGTKTGFGTNKIKIGAKKIFSDGSLSSRSAALLEPYSDAPDEKGLLVCSEKVLYEQIKDAYDAGMEVAIHAIGDRAMEAVLTAIEKVYDPHSENKNKFRIIHAILVQQQQIERMKKLPIILDVQPIFIKNWVHSAEERVGSERVKLFLPFKTFIENGLIVTGGSDAPVAEVNPFHGIQCMVTRQDLNGFPEGGFLPEQALSVYEAVSLFTKNAAHCTNEEGIKGTLEKGKLADFIALDKDIFAVKKHEISKLKILQTVVGGETTWLS